MEYPDVRTAAFFDWWRDNYDYLTPEMHDELNDVLYQAYPKQSHFQTKWFGEALAALPTNQIWVFEVGGWDGELACNCYNYLGQRIKKWTNMETNRLAVKNTVPMHLKFQYDPIVPTKFDWFKEPRDNDYSAFLSSHTIEHLSDAHAIQLLDHVRGIPLLVIAAPLEDGNNNWDLFYGTHKLELGWNAINDHLAADYAYERLSHDTFKYVLK